MLRTKKLTIMVTDEERAMAEAFAESSGQTVSDVVRQYIRREYAKLATPSAKAARR